MTAGRRAALDPGREDVGTTSIHRTTPRTGAPGGGIRERGSSPMAKTARPVLNQETPEPHESQTAEQLVALLVDVIAQHYLTGLTYRDVHVKSHAAVEAEFI